MVPVGSTTCVVCETPIDPPPRLPVINAQLNNLDDIKVFQLLCIRLQVISKQGKPVCLACGTVNGAEMKMCVTCEKPLESRPTVEHNNEQQSENKMTTADNTVRIIIE